MELKFQRLGETIGAMKRTKPVDLMTLFIFAYVTNTQWSTSPGKMVESSPRNTFELIHEL